MLYVNNSNMRECILGGMDRLRDEWGKMEGWRGERMDGHSFI